MQTIFNNPSIYFNLKEKTQRNQKCFTPYISIDGVETEDFANASGGIVNVLSFLLRVVILSISSNRRFIILDEAFNNLSIEYRANVSEFLKLLADRLNMQFFIVSHTTELNAAADKLYEITKKDGFVKFTEIKQ